MHAIYRKLLFEPIYSNIIAVLEFLLQVIIKKMLKTLKNDEKNIFRSKGKTSACIMNYKLKYISPLKVSKGSECVKVH